MRQIVLDTETTGLDAALGHRVIEVAAVEVVNRRFTDRHFHRYVNPEREIEAGAMEVHGINNEFLADKPKFRDIAGDLLEFLEGAELIIHNAPFDVAFLDAELGLLGREPIGHYCPVVTDTLKMAKALHPGKRNSLDALCERYAVDNSARTLHGALLDARLLAEVYLAMTRGQDSLLIDQAETAGPGASALRPEEMRNLVVLRASAEELALHFAQLDDIERAAKAGCLWKRLQDGSR